MEILLDGCEWVESRPSGEDTKEGVGLMGDDDEATYVGLRGESG